MENSYYLRRSTTVYKNYQDDFWRVSNQFLQISTVFVHRSRAQMCINIMLSRTHAIYRYEKEKKKS